MKQQNLNVYHNLSWYLKAFPPADASQAFITRELGSQLFVAFRVADFNSDSTGNEGGNSKGDQVTERGRQVNLVLWSV